MIIFNDWEVKQRLEEREAKERYHLKVGYNASRDKSETVLEWLKDTLGLAKKIDATTETRPTRKAS